MQNSCGSISKMKVRIEELIGHMTGLAHVFYIDKSTGTFADELTAAGLITVLKWLYHWQGIERPAIIQIDKG